MTAALLFVAGVVCGAAGFVALREVALAWRYRLTAGPIAEPDIPAESGGCPWCGGVLDADCSLCRLVARRELGAAIPAYLPGGRGAA